MKLSERLNVLVQAITLSQKSGALTLDEAVKAKTAIDVISTGNLNQNYTSSINVLIEIAAASQKKGVYSLKDAHMVYLAVEGIETELQNEVNRINAEMMEKQQTQQVNNVNQNNKTHIGGNVVSIPPKKLNKKS